MLISEKAYRKLINCPAAPPEIGGILGSRNGVVCELCFDVQEEIYNCAKYTPNVAYLNSVIQSWAIQGVTFTGLFHTHPGKQNRLSMNDKEYIKAIMKALSDVSEELYFPVVLPRQEVCSYRAIVTRNEVTIHEDGIILVD